MLFKIVGLIIGVLIFGAGIYYLNGAKNDPESKKIYTIFIVVGAVIAAASALMLVIG